MAARTIAERRAAVAVDLRRCLACKVELYGGNSSGG